MATGPAFEPTLAHGAPTNTADYILNIVAGVEGAGMGAGAVFAAVAGALPGLSTQDVLEGISLAEQRIAAGEAFGTPDVFRKPRLSEIPLCPGCPANKIEVEIDIQVSSLSDTKPWRSGGSVRAIFNHIPDQQELADIAEEFAEEVAANYPTEQTGFQLTEWYVTSAQRGSFFGR